MLKDLVLKPADELYGIESDHDFVVLEGTKVVGWILCDPHVSNDMPWF